MTYGKAFGSFIRRLRNDRRGTTAVVFAFCAIPIVAMIGASLDYGRALLLRNQLQTAADAAVLAAGARGSLNDEELEAYARNYFRSNGGNPEWAKDISFELSRVDSGLRASVSGTVTTSLVSVIGIDEIQIAANSEIKVGSGQMEIALVLDNTGSMRNDMDELRQGARDLVNQVFDAAQSPGDAKIAIVPYVGAVNIGTDDGQMAWMDTDADAEWHGRNFEWQWTFFKEGCEYTEPGGGGGGGGPGSGNGDDRSSSLLERLRQLNHFANAVVGVTPAFAESGSGSGSGSGNSGSGSSGGGGWNGNNVPPGYMPAGADTVYAADCWASTPPKVNHFTIFNQLGVAWKGCVEARAEPYDVDDTAPNPDEPNTLFVPYLWPDEADAGAPDVWNPFPNSYLTDADDQIPSPWRYSWEGGRVHDYWKYGLGNAPDVDETAPFTNGPNASCPDPVLPLTDSRNSVLATIDGLSHWEGSGTVSSEGVAWGWRVLSPTEPFTEGQPYGDVTKVIVLMTDGKNAAAAQASGATYSDYTAYNYLTDWRVGGGTYDGYTHDLDDRMLQACTNAKAQGVKIYTITFGVLDDETRSLYEDCATSPPFHYNANTAQEMMSAFRNIGGQLSALRVTH